MNIPKRLTQQPTAYWIDNPLDRGSGEDDGRSSLWRQQFCQPVENTELNWVSIFEKGGGHDRNGVANWNIYLAVGQYADCAVMAWVVGVSVDGLVKNGKRGEGGEEAIEKQKRARHSPDRAIAGTQSWALLTHYHQ